MGIDIPQLQQMELWEFYVCMDAYKKKQEQRAEESVAESWQIGNFVGAAFGGKLKRLKHYLDGVHKKQDAPKISIEEFEAKLKLVQEGGGIGGT